MIVGLAAFGSAVIFVIVCILIAWLCAWIETSWKTVKNYRTAASLQEACDRLSEENVALKAKITLLENKTEPYRS